MITAEKWKVKHRTEEAAKPEILCGILWNPWYNEKKICR
jgi:hypothetical protein